MRSIEFAGSHGNVADPLWEQLLTPADQEAFLTGADPFDLQLDPLRSRNHIDLGNVGGLDSELAVLSGSEEEDPLPVLMREVQRYEEVRLAFHPLRIAFLYWLTTVPSDV